MGTRQRDHRGRDVDAEDVIAGIDDDAGENAAAASKIDNCAARMTGPIEFVEKLKCGVARERTMTRVVNEGEVGSVGSHESRTPDPESRAPSREIRG